MQILHHSLPRLPLLLTYYQLFLSLEALIQDTKVT